MKRICAIALALVLLMSGAKAAGAEAGVTSDTLYVQQVKGLRDDFILGADVSSLLVQEQSGVVYRGFDGQPRDMLQVLADNGVNYVRVRVWVDPFDSDGHGYGGGNCTAATAAEIGARAARYGMKLLVDFHYSDFWADPGKQMVPKAWAGLSVDEKAERIRTYTTESLTAIRDAGADIGMVQIGNETNNGICGETDWSGMCTLFRAGTRAVRAFDPRILVAVHFTDPQNGNYRDLARALANRGVDYDVFASSYYPYWHGTLENLKAQLSAVAREYRKKVMVVETQWPYTTEDGDGQGRFMEELLYGGAYPVTVQGQSRAIRDLVDAVASLRQGIGVFYWEAGWIPVPANSPQARSDLWEACGSGWASSFAGAYDPEDAGQFYGGSACDHQALFDFQGNPLESLKTFALLRTGNEAPRVTDALDCVSLKLGIGEELTLPETVPAILTDGARAEAVVAWDAKAVAQVDTGKEGQYVIPGVGDGKPTLCYVTVAEVNYLNNPGFEDKDRSMWDLVSLTQRDQGDYQVKAQDAHAGEVALHFWDSAPIEFKCEQTVTDLPAGNWRVVVRAQGDEVGPDADICLYVIADGLVYTAPITLRGWAIWQEARIEHVPCTSGTLTVGVYVRCQAGGWGTFDDFALNLER